MNRDPVLTSAMTDTLAAIVAIQSRGGRAGAHEIARERGMLHDGNGSRNTGVRSAIRRSITTLSRHGYVTTHYSRASTVFSNNDQYEATEKGVAYIRSLADG